MPIPYFKSTPFESKKFMAFLIAETTWKIMLVVALLVFKEQLQAATVWGWWFMLATIIVTGFVEVMYIGGQAALDKYVRVAEITTKGPPQEPKE